MKASPPILFDEHGRLRSGWRAVIFVLVFAFIGIPVWMAVSGIVSVFKVPIPRSSLREFLLNSIVSLIPALLAGWICGKLLEGLPLRALGASFTRGWLKHFVLGCLIGGLTLSFAVLIAFAFGGLQFRFDAGQTTNSIVYSLGVSFVIFAVASAFEEVLCRGYFLQTMSRSGLAWLGIAITSLVFGVGHFGNPDAGLVSTANTVLAGIWFSIAYLKTRDLWFVWGLHLMWNWMQGSFFGIEVSGITNVAAAPLLREVDAGPQWLTGTTYGVEGGIVCTIALIVSTAAIWFMPFLKPDPEMLAMTSKSEPLGLAGLPKDEAVLAADLRR